MNIESLKAALQGRQGSIDEWLETHSEAEVKAAILQLSSEAAEVAFHAAKESASDPAYTNRDFWRREWAGQALNAMISSDACVDRFSAASAREGVEANCLIVTAAFCLADAMVAADGGFGAKERSN